MKRPNLTHELKFLLDHPAYKFLRAQCEYYGYTLKQLPHDSSGFQVGDSVFYSVEYLSGTAEEFLDKVLLPKYAEVTMQRISDKSREDRNSASSIYASLVERFYNHRDEEFNLKQIYEFYASLEDFAVSLHKIRYIRAPHDQQLNFRLYTNPDVYFQFCANKQYDLVYCFRFLRSAYLCELFDSGYDTMAEDIVKDIVADFAEPQNIELAFDLASSRREVFSPSRAYCMITGYNGISFHQYDIDVSSLYQLQQDVSVAKKIQFSDANLDTLQTMLNKFNKTSKYLNQFGLTISEE